MLIVCWLAGGFFTNVALSLRVRRNLGYGLFEKFPNDGGFFGWLGLTFAGFMAAIAVFAFWPLVILLWKWAVRFGEEYPNLVMQSTFR